MTKTSKKKNSAPKQMISGLSQAIAMGKIPGFSNPPKKKVSTRSITSNASSRSHASKSSKSSRRGKQHPKSSTKIPYGCRYGQAVLSPFECSASDCRVPDMCSFPTITFTTKGQYSVKLPGGSTGTGSLVFTAAPHLSLINMEPFDSAQIISNTMTHYGSGINAPFWAVANWAEIQSRFAQFRVTAVGYRIRSLIPALSDTGTFIFAKVPSVGQLPGNQTLDQSGSTTFGGALSTTGVLANLTGIGTGASSAFNANLSSAIKQLDRTTLVTTRGLTGQAIEFTLLPVTPQAYDFVNTSTSPFGQSVNGNMIQLNGAIHSTDGTVSIEYASSSTVHLGFENLLFYWEGIPTNIENPIFEIEYVYHYEGIANVSPEHTLVSSGQSKTVINPDALVKAHRSFADAPVAKIARTVGGYGLAAIGGYSGGGALGAITSLLAKASLE